MSNHWKKPILIGGVGLSFALWLMETLPSSASEFGGWSMLGLLAVGTGSWWWKQLNAPSPDEIDFSPADRTQVDRALDRARNALAGLENELSPETPEFQHLQRQLADIEANVDRPTLRVAVAGGKRSGKTTVVRTLDAAWNAENGEIALTELPAWFVPENPPEEIEATIDADLVVFLSAGDVTATEFLAVDRLVNAGRRVLIAWNKQDCCPEEQRESVLLQLRRRWQDTLDIADIVAVSAQPADVEVRQAQSDGEFVSRPEVQAAQISPLVDRLVEVYRRDGKMLVFATAIRQANAVTEAAKQQLNQLRRDRALPLVSKYQWIAAAAAFANPVLALDLLSTGAVGAQLIVDLGAIYQQKFSLDRARTAAGTMGELMVKLGLVELSTQAVSAVLKHHPVTFVAGGTVQGLSAAYLTRLAGLTLIEYFESEEIAAEAENFNVDRLGATLKRVFQENQRTAFLNTLVERAKERFAIAKPSEVKTVS